jgi:hypothetical protein
VALPWFTVAQKTRKCVALQSDLGRPAAARKIFRFAFPANQLPLRCVLSREEGRWTLGHVVARFARGRAARLAYGEVVWF